MEKSNVRKMKYEDLDKFTPQELQLFVKNAYIFANEKANTCPECLREKSPMAENGIPGIGLCLFCVEDRLKKQLPVGLGHLPERWPAGSDLVMMAKGLMAKHHEDALKASVAYLFKLKHGETNGKIVLGTTAKQSPKNKMLHGWDYIIEIAWDMWAMFNDFQREALLLHEICHIYKEDKNWKIESHNVEEFVRVIEVYGLWKPDLQAFALAIKNAEESGDTRQMAMFSGGVGDAVGGLLNGMSEGDSIQFGSGPKLVKKDGKVVKE